MPKADKNKVSQKQKPVHPLSRKAQVLSKQVAREQRVNHSHAKTTIKNDVIAQKLIWFQQEVDQERKDFTKRDLIEYTKQYLRRFDDELDQIAIIKAVGNRQGHQHTARKSAIQLSIERDQQMLETSGLEVPDIINGNHLDTFRKWDGDLFAVQNIKTRKLFKKDFEEVPVEATEKTTE
ncbi:translation machinery-associated protein 16-like [Mytilus trossulus]|uniref:translation machinery-associated protein 16-like n=1 Tax=Mytilus trossulus TaxID=6551 RepID=UPI00300663B8